MQEERQCANPRALILVIQGATDYSSLKIKIDQNQEIFTLDHFN